MIPYIISEAHPDYKRPYLNQEFGVINEEDLDTFFLDKICKFILDRIDIHSLTCCVDIEDFFDSFYQECYMANSVWDAMIFKNGEWENVHIMYTTIWDHIQLIKSLELENELNTNNKLDTVKNNVDWGLDDQEKIDQITNDMREFFEELLKEDPLPIDFIEKFRNMNSCQQLLYLFGKSSNIKIEKYLKKRDLFFDFVNLCIKSIQKDMEDITQKMSDDKNNNLDFSEQLKEFMETYSNLILLKQTLHF